MSLLLLWFIFVVEICLKKLLWNYNLPWLHWLEFIASANVWIQLCPLIVMKSWFFFRGINLYDQQTAVFMSVIFVSIFWFNYLDDAIYYIRIQSHGKGILKPHELLAEFDVIKNKLNDVAFEEILKSTQVSLMIH